MTRVRMILLVSLLFAAMTTAATAYERIPCGNGFCSWQEFPVRFAMSATGTPDIDNEEEIVQKSFYRWDMDHQGFCGVFFRYEGKVSTTVPTLDGINAVYWIEQGWDSGPEALAVTQCWFDAKGFMIDCDISINSQDYQWEYGENAPPGSVDLLSTLTHEVGHLLGLAHTDIQEATMYPYYDFRSNAADLDHDDILGMWDSLCEGTLIDDDPWEQNDTQVHARDWELPFTFLNIRLFDDDWFKFRLEPGMRVKVSVRDERRDRIKTVALTDHRGDVLDQGRCIGDCALAFGEPSDESLVRYVFVRGDYDKYPVETYAYDLQVEAVAPGDEGDLFDDDDDRSGSSDSCGCDFAGAYGGTDGSPFVLAVVFAIAVIFSRGLRARFSGR